MTAAAVHPSVTRRGRGWLGVGALVLVYAGLFAANYWVPPGPISYTSRLWDWSQTALTVAAGLARAWLRRLPQTRVVGLGLALAGLSAISHARHNPSLAGSLQEGLAVWVCFVAGASLCQHQARGSVRAFQPPLTQIGRSLMVGSLAAIPLAGLNNLYFFLNAGAAQFQPVWSSAFEALSPAIHEEIVYRYFVLALTLHLLGPDAAPRPAIITATVLAVVPHSLNHLPELFLAQPLMGLAMLAATSLLFGLPMASLQVKRNLEAAIAFHWLIDFVRFWFGF